MNPSSNLHNNLRQQFPIFGQPINGQSLIYLDSAATTQKPKVVIDSQIEFYSRQYSSNHSVHFLANQCSLMVESSRQCVASFLKCESKEIVFTAGSTHSLNLLANAFLFNFLESNSNLNLTKDSRILVCIAEHHSNILPWQRLSKLIGCQLEYFGLTPDGQIDLLDLESKLKSNTSKVNLVCVSHVSNVLATINPLDKICNLSHKYNSLVVADGTQAVSHLEVDMQKLDVDFYCFSGHKIYGPTGIGVLYGKSELLNKLSVDQVGGEMVNQVELLGNNYKSYPWKFEAGTANFAGIIGLKSALDWFVTNKVEIEKIEIQLQKYLHLELKKIPDLRIIGSDNPKNRIPLFSCYLPRINSLDLAIELDLWGIAIRSGQHCTGLLHEYLDVFSTWRVSLAAYNTNEDIDFFITKLKQVISKFG
jgi:cysteine desulfurase / selenocysteine lyase